MLTMIEKVEYLVWIDDKKLWILDSGRFDIVWVTIPVGSIVRVPGSQVIRSLAETMAEGEFCLTLRSKEAKLLLHGVPSRKYRDTALLKPTIKIEDRSERRIVHEFNNCSVRHIDDEIPSFVDNDVITKIYISFYGYQGELAADVNQAT